MTRLTYAIGDIHGCYDLLLQAARRISVHAAGREHRVICLGDYVDRGPDSRQVVEYLMARTAEGGFICLKGNHEAMMVEACSDRRFSQWLDNGGEETLLSYRAEVPSEHIDWMAALPILRRDDHRVFVHAGLLPRTSLEDQDDDACLWIRGRFLRAPASELPCHVVHGHTPLHEAKILASEPELLPHRTNLDTGAYASGVLAIGVFEDDRPGGPVEVLYATD